MIKATTKWLLRGLAGLLAAVILVAGVGVWRLAQGPISLAFLRPYLSEALSMAEAGFNADVSDAVLSWGGWERNLGVEAINVKLIGQEGQVFASIPKISVNVSLRSLLLGRFAVTNLDIQGANLALERDAEGRLHFGVIALGGEPAPLLPPTRQAQEPEAATGPSFGEQFLMAFAQNSDPGTAMGALRELRILSADLTLFDGPNGRTWHAPRSDLVVRRTTEGVEAQFLSNITLEGKTARLLLDAVYRLETDSFDIEFTFDNFLPRPFLQQAESTASFAGFDAPMSGRIETRIGPDRLPQSFRFDVAAGAGRIDWPTIFAQPVPLRQAKLVGSLEAGENRILLDESFVELGPRGAVDFQGSIQFDRENPSVETIGARIEARLRDLTTDVIVRAWPVIAAPGAREWVAANFQAGLVPQGQLRLQIAPGDLAKPALPEAGLSLEFELQDATLAYLRPMPPLTNVKAQARVTGNAFSATVTSGNVGPVALREGQVRIAPFDKLIQDVEIEFVAEGGARDILTLLNYEPLGFPRKMDLNPASASGSAVVRTRLEFPAIDELELDQLKVRAAANLRDAAVKGIADRFDLSNGAFLIQVTDSGLQANGTGSLNGAAVGVEWSEDFTGREANRSRYRLNGILDDRDRRALGVNLAPYITGPVSVDVTLVQPRNDSLRATGQLRLRDARMAVEEFAWTKPPGQNADLSFDVFLRAGDVIDLREARLNAPGAQGKMSGHLTGGQVQRLAIENWQSGKNSIQGLVERQADGTLSARFQGSVMDLRPLLRDEESLASSAPSRPQASANAAPQSSAAPQEPPPPPLRFELQLAEAILSDDLTVKNLGARGHLNSAREPLSLNVIANFLDRGGFNLSITPDDKGRALILTSDNGGTFVRFLGLTSIQGGRVSVAGRYDSMAQGTPLKGTATLENFKVVGAPVLARLLTLGSLTGIGETLTGDGISFDRADVPFELGADVLVLRGAKTYGPSMGITAQGNVNLKTDEMNLTGTLIPAYTLNTILGHIPLLGPLLTGRQGEGILGMTYTVRGSASDPQVGVNPLSLLAPGFLRRLFEPADPNEPFSPLPPPADGAR